MKLLSILTLQFLLTCSLIHAQHKKIGVLYLDNHSYTRETQKWIDSVDVPSNLEVITLGYNANNRLEVFNSLMEENVDVVIGPSDSETLKEIDALISRDFSNSTFESKPYFICPTISTPQSSFSNVDFLKITSTNAEKASFLYSKLIDKFGINEIGLYYENNTWGLDIFARFDENPDLKIIGKPFPAFDSDRGGNYPEINKFIESLAYNDIKLIVLAPWKEDMIKFFLQSLKEYNRDNISTYHPILVLFSNYPLSNVDIELFRYLKIFGITELINPNNEKVSEEIANTVDAFKLTVSILEETETLDEFITRFTEYQERLNRQVDLTQSSFHTIRYLQESDDNLLLYSGNRIDNALQKTSLLGFSDYTLIRIWETKVEPFLAYQNFVRNPIILLIFLTLTFLSFAVFMHNEYYTPFRTLFQLKSFWYWFIVYSFTTMMVIIFFLYSGYIKSNQIIVIVTAGLACPLIMNYVFKQLSNINIPVPLFSSYVQDFIRRLKENLELAFEKTAPTIKFNRVVDHINDVASFHDIRMNVYNLILDLRSNALTKKFAEELKIKMDQVDENFPDEVIEIRDGLRKKLLIDFYVKILYFTSIGEKSFKRRLYNSGLVRKEEVKQIMESIEELEEN
ncbi:MAG: hypothetical protein CMB80_18705 [Flammeovirgaceae bacterium]|nr:hypothetical protein [Flammeovirgaceae bacterium]MBR11014.1 hypothetical protein [Rickettsiales bacterium]